MEDCEAMEEEEIVSEKTPFCRQQNGEIQDDVGRQRLMGRLPEVHETSERDLRQLQQRARLTELQLETVYEGIKVKREKMEEHFAREAQLQSDVMAMSESALQLTQTLAECKETLECCVCLERPVRFVAVPCGHHFCGHANCHSSQVAECPTCRTPLTGRTELFGACSWLADMFESIDAAASASSYQDGSAVGAAAGHARSTDDLELVQTAIRGAETVVAMMEHVVQVLLPTASIAVVCCAKRRTTASTGRTLAASGDGELLHQHCCARKHRLAPQRTALELRQRATVNEIHAEALYAGIKVKREEMDDSFATQAQLESTVTSMSEIILEHKSRLVEFKEALECCICFERSIRYVCLPCGHCFCFHIECHSSNLLECATCRQKISGKQQLFGACTWLADLLECVDVSGELNLSKNSSTHHSVALSKQIQAKMEGIFTTADKVMLSVDEAMSQIECDYEVLPHMAKEDALGEPINGSSEQRAQGLGMQDGDTITCQSIYDELPPPSKKAQKNAGLVFGKASGSKAADKSENGRAGSDGGRKRAQGRAHGADVIEVSSDEEDLDASSDAASGYTDSDAESDEVEHKQTPGRKADGGVSAAKSMAAKNGDLKKQSASGGKASPGRAGKEASEAGEGGNAAGEGTQQDEEAYLCTKNGGGLDGPVDIVLPGENCSSWSSKDFCVLVDNVWRRDRGFQLLEVDAKSRKVLERAGGSEGGGGECRVMARLWYCSKELEPRGGFEAGKHGFLPLCKGFRTWVLPDGSWLPVVAVQKTRVQVENDYKDSDEGILSLKKGELATASGEEANGWANIRTDSGQEGWFPASYIKEICKYVELEEEEDKLTVAYHHLPTSRHRGSSSGRGAAGDEVAAAKSKTPSKNGKKTPQKRLVVEVHLEDQAAAVVNDTTEEIVVSTQELKNKLAGSADESDLEEGEIRDTDEIGQTHELDEHVAQEGQRAAGRRMGVDKRDLALDDVFRQELEEKEVLDETACAQSAGGTDLRSPELCHRRRLCSAWVLGSCQDAKCQDAHGYRAEMCPHLWAVTSMDIPDSLCPRGKYCCFAHSTNELQEMLDSRVVHRNIDEISIMPKLCAAELGNDRCSRGSACPFAHSTRELLKVLDGTSVFRTVKCEVYLQPDRRLGFPRRSILCQHWTKGRCKNSDSECDFSHGIDKSTICRRRHHSAHSADICAFFHPRDVSAQLALASHKRHATLVPQTVFVAGLLKTVQVADVHSMMEAFGKVEEIRIIEGKGSALVTFADTMSGVQAINILNLIVQIPGSDQPLTVQWSRREFDTRSREREGTERDRERPHHVFDRKSTVVSGVAELREAGRLMKGQHHLPGEISGNDSMEEGEILDSMEEGQIHPPPHHSLKEFLSRGLFPGTQIKPSQSISLDAGNGMTSTRRATQSREQFARSFALNQKILKSQSLEALQDICRHSISDFNAVNVATACRRSTKLLIFNHGRKCTVQRAEPAIRVVSMLFSRMTEILKLGSKFDCKSFSTIWWSFGTLSPILGSRFLDIVSTDVLEAKTIDALVNEHDKFEGQNIATFLWGKVSVGHLSFTSEIQEKALLEMILSKIEQFNAFDLSQTIWALSKITCSPAQDLLCGFKTRFKALLHMCGPIDIANSVLGLHKLDVDFGELVPVILSRVKQVEAGWTLKEMCSLMYTLGKLVKDKKTDCTSAADVMDLFIETMLASGEVFRSDSQQICMMFSSISKMNYRPSPIFVSALTRRAHEVKNEFTSQGVNQMLQAVAESPEFRTQSLLSDLIQLLPRTLPQANIQELCEKFVSLAKIGVLDSGLVQIDVAEAFAAVVSCIREKINEFPLLDLVRVGTGIVTLGGQEKGENESGIQNRPAWAAKTRVRLEAGEVGGHSIAGWDAFLVKFRDQLFARMRTTDKMVNICFTILMRVLAYIARTIPLDVEKKLMLLAKDQVHCFDSHDVNISLWSIAQLHDRLPRLDREVINMIVRRGIEINLTLEAHACSNCVWSLSIISVAGSFKESTDFLRLIEDRVIALLAQSPGDFQWAHIKNVLCSLAQLQHKPTDKLIRALLDRARCLSSQHLLDQGDAKILKKALKDVGCDSSLDTRFLDCQSRSLVREDERKITTSSAAQCLSSSMLDGRSVVSVEPGGGAGAGRGRMAQGSCEREEECRIDSDEKTNRTTKEGQAAQEFRLGAGGGAGRGRPVPAWQTRPDARIAQGSGERAVEPRIDNGEHLCRTTNKGQAAPEFLLCAGGGAVKGRPVPACQTRSPVLAAPPSAHCEDKRRDMRRIANDKHPMDDSIDIYPSVKRLKPTLKSEGSRHLAEESARSVETGESAAGKARNEDAAAQGWSNGSYWEGTQVGKCPVSKTRNCRDENLNESERVDPNRCEASQLSHGAMRRVRAWAEFAADSTTHVQLALAEGDVIHVLHEANQDGWGYGINDAGREGYFPMTHVDDIPPSPPVSRLVATDSREVAKEVDREKAPHDRRSERETEGQKDENRKRIQGRAAENKGCKRVRDAREVAREVAREKDKRAQDQERADAHEREPERTQAHSRADVDGGSKGANRGGQQEAASQGEAVAGKSWQEEGNCSCKHFDQKSSEMPGDASPGEAMISVQDASADPSSQSQTVGVRPRLQIHEIRIPRKKPKPKPEETDDKSGRGERSGKGCIARRHTPVAREAALEIIADREPKRTRLRGDADEGQARGRHHRSPSGVRDSKR